MSLKEKLFGSYSKRELKHIEPIKQKVLDLESKYQAMSDKELRSQTELLKQRLANGETLDDILPDAFAVCREASFRVINIKHFPVQIIGGIVLHQGRIAEMKTGEGKTFVAMLPAYLNALTGNGVHVVTVNEYLAKHQSDWVGKVYKFLGLSVGLILNNDDSSDKKTAYNADISYTTNNALGFDYLRDNMVIYKQEKVQRPLNYCIVDEVDSILIDEARTPLIISGSSDGREAQALYQAADGFAKHLKVYKVVERDMKENDDHIEADYIVDEKAKTCTLTASGIKKAEAHFHLENSLTDPENFNLKHAIDQAIRAYGIMQLDVDYVVKDGEVIIVDEFTGRLMEGRRYNEGLHQAIEAKEGVRVQSESKTMATITFQNYFRLYNKLSGMTGTALTEQDEFNEIYKLDIIEVPTNEPIVRKDLEDVVYKTIKAKYDAVVNQVCECHEKGQPVLVGTISIDKSEELSALLKRKGVKHEVLNAKQHEKEAEIVAQAGKFGAVTIATNMAGRGTDIMLGGNADHLAIAKLKKSGLTDQQIADATSFSETEDAEILELRKQYRDYIDEFKKQIQPEAEKVKQAGGLFIIGTERHESRRIDNQLRGRSGRQGDPGESKFFLSLEDDLMRLFGGEKIQNLMTRLNVDEDQPIETKLLTNTIESAQRKIEGRNFAIRKSVLAYDDVMNAQRTLIYEQRNKVLNDESLKDTVQKMLEEIIESDVKLFLADNEIHDDWNIEGLRNNYLGILTSQEDWANKEIGEQGEVYKEYNVTQLSNLNRADIIKELTDRAKSILAKKEQDYGEGLMREIERVTLLRTVDESWIDHIDAMDVLKKGIHLRAYGQQDPVVAYRVEGFDMFDEMIDNIKRNTAIRMLTVQVSNPNNVKRQQVAKPTTAIHGESDKTLKKQPIHKEKIGMNDPCPCGSGKKYKKCCGMNQAN